MLQLRNIWDPNRPPKENGKHILSIYICSPPIYLAGWVISVYYISEESYRQWNGPIRLVIVLFYVAFTWPILRCLTIMWRMRKNKKTLQPKQEDFNYEGDDAPPNIGQTEQDEIEAVKEKQRKKKGNKKRQKFQGKVAPV
mmetsp:Transcript_33904/g.44722  ORF Transcript_33904/g.44722 Transcript_33904/m.44722 type:complete len:140 (+) Transcript_33904:331-750(+)